MSTHKVVCTDEVVRGRPGTVARCSCGWTDYWGIRDGSAECSAEYHMIENDQEYAEERNRRALEWGRKTQEEFDKVGCICQVGPGYLVVGNPECTYHHKRREPVVVKSKEHKHNCSCHINPPCSNCVDCRHWDVDDCEEDCQTCEVHGEGE